MGDSKRTDAVDLELDARAHDLIPPVDAPYQPPAPLERPRAAERMREGGRRGEVLFQRRALEGGRGLGQEVDDAGDLSGWRQSFRFQYQGRGPVEDLSKWGREEDVLGSSIVEGLEKERRRGNGEM